MDQKDLQVTLTDDQTLQTLQRAAAQQGLSVERYVAIAIQQQLKKRAGAHHRASHRPKPTYH